MMRKTLRLLLFVVLLIPMRSGAQDLDRIRFNDQDLFLSGSNVAWINFARDIGPGDTDLDRFEEIFRELHESGGNAMRIWLHTTGAVTPEWDGSEVVGPGEGAIEDLQAILDLAWRYEVGLQLCLWSFDMLRRENGPGITDRAFALLTDPALTQTYVDNALVPMVEALEGHPGIIAWEIFNEAEGMSEEYGWNFNRHVPMADIQRFVNLTAGAIHRTDTSAQVTNGAWSFSVLWDGTPAKRGEVAQPVPDPAEQAQAEHAPAEPTPAELAPAELKRATDVLSAKYRHDLSEDEVRAHFAKLQAAAADQNFYSDDALIAAGGDPDGTLDFYNVHYYEWAGTAQSPFHHDVEYWGLDKPLVVGEFFLGEGSDGDSTASYGVAWEDMYTTLYDRGYAGALGWQWFNYPISAEGVVNWPRMLENTETMWALHRDAVDVDAGFRMLFFEADPPGIEEGGTSELSWAVSGAAAVTLDGEPVDSVGTAVVSPDTTTVYSLVGQPAGGEAADTLTVTVEVLDPENVNRARMRAAVASSEETCCGPTLSASFAFDGSMSTRWSSEWQDGLADEDPDDEWIYVDLGQAYDIHRVVLAWEAAYGAAYEIDVSYDGFLWTSVYEEVTGDGGTDEIAFDAAPSGRYVRMRGIERATQWGYSLYEFEVYGLPSTKQPPGASFTSPAEGIVVAPGSSITLRADAEDPDGTVEEVVFYADGELISTMEGPPFEAEWEDLGVGEHGFHAIITDDDGISVRTETQFVYAVEPNALLRFEAEDASYSGDVTRQSSPAASTGSYLDMRDTGTITFDGIAPGADGEYLLTFGYNLYYDVPKAQYLLVNGDTLTELNFTGDTQTWLERGVRVPLRGGVNTIEIRKFWGWMYFDYVAVSVDPLNVSTDENSDVADVFSLEQNYPNPFNPATVISYALPRSGHVRLVVYDAVGRRVATLVDGVRSGGTHSARFEPAGLSSGVYFYRLEAGDFVQTRKMLLMR